MEISSFRCLADLGMEDPFLMQLWPYADAVDGSGDYNFDDYQSYNENYDNSAHNNKIMINSDQPVFDLKRSSPESSLIHDYSNAKPEKQIKTARNDGGFSYLPRPEEESVYKYCSGTALNFSSGESVVTTGNQNYGAKSSQAASSGSNGNRLGQDHIMAERKRREKLSQRFIALSTLLPGLKKMDKASVLGDAINHIKQLQEKVKTLEDQTQKKTMESMVFVRRYEVPCPAESGEDSSTDDRSTSSGGTTTTTESLPEIEARFSGRDVLVSILCEKRKGVVEKAVGEIEKLHLSVVNCSIISFGDSALSITVIAQKDKELRNNMDLVKNLRGALKTFI